MEIDEARAVLGVASAASQEEVRRAFRARIHRFHPDVAPGDPDAARLTGRLVEAYAVLRRQPPSPELAPLPPGPAVPAPAWPSSTPSRRATVEGDTLAYAAPRRHVFQRLVAVADQIGDVTYVDPDARVLDTVITLVDGMACSLLASLADVPGAGPGEQPGLGVASARGRGALGQTAGTEVVFTLEPLGGEAPPPVAPLVAAVAALLDATG